MKITFFATAIICAFLDILSKDLAFLKVKQLHHVDLIEGILRFRCTTNKGIIFGLFQEASLVFFIISIIAVPAIVIIFLSLKRYTLTLVVSLGLILGGTIGNLFDRIASHEHAVRDFIDFYLINWPVFNLADSFILIGTIVLIAELTFFEEKRKKIDATITKEGQP